MKKTEDCFFKVKNYYLKFLKKEKIYNSLVFDKISNLKNIYIPLSFWIEREYQKKRGKTLFLGFSGGQGSGKTTITKILKIILKIFFKRNICIISIDDLYKTFRERQKMAHNIHPLLKIRGVPGTHDVNLLKNFFNALKNGDFMELSIDNLGMQSQKVINSP